MEKDNARYSQFIAVARDDRSPQDFSLALGCDPTCRAVPIVRPRLRRVLAERDRPLSVPAPYSPLG